MNTTLHAIYDDRHQAERAAEQLAALGIERSAIRLVAAPAARAVAGGVMGSFDDGQGHMHAAESGHVGSFADSEGHVHTPERDHVGSFADVAPPHKGATALVDELRGAGLPSANAREYAARVAAGASVLLVRASEDQAARVEEILRSA
ncbi:MAG TPA: hypothetical protein VF897_21105 [Roseiflexaceae bacterium]